MKPRSDSLFAKLQPAQREELFTAAYVEGRALTELIEMCRKRFDVSASLGSLHSFLSRHGLSWRVEQAKATAEKSIGSLPKDWRAQQKEALAQQIFAATLGTLSTKEAVMLKSIELEELKIGQKDREITLKVKALELRVKEFETKIAEAKAKIDRTLSKAKNKGGVSMSTIEEIEQTLNLL